MPDAQNGKPHYVAQRIPGVNNTYASPVAAGGKIYLTDRNGTITVIEDSDKLNVLATNQLGEGVDATPAIVDKRNLHSFDWASLLRGCPLSRSDSMLS